MTVLIGDILDPAALEEAIAQRHIKVVPSPDGRMDLYDYTDRCAYERAWNRETIACRGLVARRRDGAVLCRPFSKFFNVDQPGIPAASSALALARGGALELTEKLDGTMVAVWYDPDARCWRATTRRNWVAEQALATLAWLEARGDMRAWPTDHTYIGEWCAPDNRVVLKYDAAEWRLIGARTPVGADLDHESLTWLGGRIGVPVVPLVTLDLAGALVAAADPGVLDREGWVARFAGGARLKIKTADYVRLHALILLFSPKRVYDEALAGRLDDYLVALPEELRPEAERLRDALLWQLGAQERRLVHLYDTHHAAFVAGGMKGLALATEGLDPLDRAALFALARDRDDQFANITWKAAREPYLAAVAGTEAQRRADRLAEAEA